LAFQRGLNSAPTGQGLKAQGWRAFRQPWEKCEYNATLKGLCPALKLDLTGFLHSVFAETKTNLPTV
jgi:hypothetical protein